MRIAVTADLHWGHGRLGDEATAALVHFLEQQPPDLLLLGGDQGTRDHFDECLQLFDAFSCPKALVPGNHDIWVGEDDPRGDSLDLYERYLPGVSLFHGFHYLDHGPLLLPDADLAVVGSMNWYDYSWSLEELRQETPDWEWRLRNKVFTFGRHNDARFVRWPLDDVAFTRQAVAAFAKHLETALETAAKVLVLTHHPACYQLNSARLEDGPRSLDRLLWDALSGNAALQQLLEKHQHRLACIFSGHTHRERASHLGDVPVHNIGGDYHYKLLLLVDWPAGTVEAKAFGDPDRRK